MPRDEKGKFTYNDELSPIQLKMIAELIANGGNKTKACEKLSVPRSTLYDWLDNELFIKSYRLVCEKMFKEELAIGVKGIIDVAKNGAGRDKVKACETLLKLNGYLDTKVDINQNTTEKIVIRLISEENEEENE